MTNKIEIDEKYLAWMFKRRSHRNRKTRLNGGKPPKTKETRKRSGKEQNTPQGSEANFV
jgi:hypothetical protein